MPQDAIYRVMLYAARCYIPGDAIYRTMIYVGRVEIWLMR